MKKAARKSTKSTKSTKTTKTTKSAKAPKSQEQTNDLAVLISAWLTDPAVGKLLDKGKIEAALARVGIQSDKLADVLSQVDPELIREIAKAADPRVIRPMG